MRTSSIVLVCAVAASVAACGNARSVQGIGAPATVCTMCHGGDDNDTGAPPRDAHGRTSSPAVGAHTAHVNTAVPCRACHANVDPGDLRFPGHQNGVADVIFTGAAVDPGNVAAPAYDRATHSCSNVYCHAPSLAPGGALPDPQWDGSIATAGCGACHAGPATIHGGGLPLTACVACHPTSVDASGAVLPPPGGTHADGAIEHFQHDPGWAATNANGVTPHGMAALYRNVAAYPTGLAGCRVCHGSSLDNPIAAGIPTCDACHQPYSLPGTAATDWRTDCTFCHGDPARAPAGAQLGDSAPPRDVLGNASSLQVGVHLSHVVGATLSDGVPCASCHTVPTSADDHVNGVTSVVLRTPLAAPSGTYAPGSATAAGTCAATYCHGSFTGGTAGNTPSWNGAGTQSACTTCHGFSPPTGRHPSASGTPHDSTSLFGANRSNCSPCHGGVATNAAPSTISPAGRALHVNGVKDVGSSSIYQWDSVNKRCYGVSCHGDSTTQYKTW